MDLGMVLLPLCYDRENNLALTIVKSTHSSYDSSGCTISTKTLMPCKVILLKEPELQDKDEFPMCCLFKLPGSEVAGWCFPASMGEYNKYLKAHTVPF